MTQLNLLDLLLLVALAASVLSACARGLGREMLHTLLFAGTVAGVYFFFAAQPAPVTEPTAETTVRTLLNFTYLAITAYLVTWALMRFGAPVFLDSGPTTPGIRSRFWAGTLALGKLTATVLLLNLWYATHSPDAHPQRLNPLPGVLRESVLVRMSDNTTEKVYRWLASNGWLTYEKYTHRPKTEEEIQNEKSQELLGIR